MSDDSFVQVYAGNYNDAVEVQLLLERNDIECFIQNELMGTIAPWQVSAGGVAPVKILVALKDLDKSVGLIKEFNQ